MNYKKTVLKNGMRIITVPMSNNPTVTVMVLVEAGSKYETKDINGISHFLEHLCFKGTKKRPTAFDITKELDGLGAQSSAFTMEEVTGYYAKAHKKHLPKLLDVISDIYANSVFDPKEIEKEKGVIIDELNMYEDAPMMHVRDIFMYALYGDQPAGWNIGGSKKNVKNMTRGDIISYREKLYVAEATTVVVSGGGFETKKLVKDIEKKFANIVDKKKATKKKVKSTQKKPNIFLEQKKTDQTHMVLGVKTYDIHSTNNPALSVLSGVLGKGMSSRLFQKIRDEMGVGYYVRVDNQALTDHGFFSVHTGVSNDRVKEVISVILKECKRLTVEEVSEKELKKVKDFLTGNFALSLESSNSLAELYGSQEILHKEIKDPKKIVQEINKVTSKDIISLAKKIFKDERLSLALIGPFKDEKVFEKILTFKK